MSSEPVSQFISRWSSATPSERANSQLFLSELCDLLGVPHPDATPEHGYSFEFEVVQHHPDGSATPGRIDLYKRGCFVLESKQFQAAQAAASQLELVAQEAGVAEKKKSSQPVRGTGAWDDAMIKARGQAERYVRSLPASEPTPPFLIVVDVGHSFEIFADFTQAGKAFLHFPDPRTFRIRLEQLADEKIRERLKLIWTDPASLDPARRSADVTLAVSGHLAELARSLEGAGHKPKAVADFLTRCLFCMFAEDVGLLPERSFTELLESLPPDGTGFQELLEQLFRELDTGTGKGISVVLRKKLLRFNGGLFSDCAALPVNGLQLGLLKAAAQQNWRNVEPAIFGTLLERALNPRERHKLGAHYTPRAYVERLVLPTVVEPLRAEWESVRAAAITHARAGDLKKARAEVNAFHDRLCQVKVLDPACGSGNFLYVALEHLKRLEGEVLDAAAQFGESFRLELQTHAVDPHQFLGIEINPRAAAITELVLWIGYLQWHFRTRGRQTMPEEPILKKFKNIECRDAVLACDGEPQPAKDDNGKEITVWDRRSYKTDLLTGREVPDETKRTPLLRYPNARPAEWPRADYIVGNPPFVANRKMREELGDGYVDHLSTAYPDIDQPVDFVMYFWKRAAAIVTCGDARAFGLVTTSRIRMPQNQSVVRGATANGARLVFAIPDHPWHHDKEDAEVRVAMTVVRPKEDDVRTRFLIAPIHDKVAVGAAAWKGEIDIRLFTEVLGREIPPDLSPQTDISNLRELKAWNGLCHAGMKPYAETLIISEQTASELFPSRELRDRHARRYRNGQDIARTPRCIRVLDFFGTTEAEIRSSFPKAYQYLVTHTKRERSQERNTRLRQEWWLFEANRPELRNSISGLRRYIVTVENSPTRYFSFLESDILPDQKLRVIASEDAFVLGVLSTRLHQIFATRSGGRHGVRNTPVYNTQCATTFAFPDCTQAQKQITRTIAEELDAHRKRVQAQHPDLTLTGMYNVLEKLRANEPLNEKEQRIHDMGLVSVLRQLHDDLDAAVFAAYGWPTTLTDAEILERLVALNSERIKEEASGLIRWLRPEYQNPTGARAHQGSFPVEANEEKPASKKLAKKNGKVPWPSTLSGRVKAVTKILSKTTEPVTADAVAARFTNARRAAVAEILETLCTMGHAHRAKIKGSYLP